MKVIKSGLIEGKFIKMSSSKKKGNEPEVAAGTEDRKNKYIDDQSTNQADSKEVKAKAPEINGAKNKSQASAEKINASMKKSILVKREDPKPSGKNTNASPSSPYKGRRKILFAEEKNKVYEVENWKKYNMEEMPTSNKCCTIF